jgi:hypothetical protein
MNPVTFEDVAPVFVCGAARSGTTLLQLMLNAHPRLSVCGEVHFFDQVCQLKADTPDLENPDDYRAFWRLLRNAEGIHRLLDRERVLSAVEERLAVSPRRSYELFYRFVMEEYARAKGAIRFGEKTPKNVWYLRELLALFPNARLIEIVRDPRAVVASAIKVPFASPDVITNAIKWKCDVRAGADSPGHYRIRYEDLTADPELELRRLCTFIGEAYDPRMLEYHRTADEVARCEPWKRGILFPVNQGSRDRWELELTPARIALVDWITEDDCRRLGYASGPLTLSRRARAIAAVPLELVRYRAYLSSERERRESRPGVLLGTSAKRFGMLRAMLGGGAPST